MQNCRKFICSIAHLAGGVKIYNKSKKGDKMFKQYYDNNSKHVQLLYSMLKIKSQIFIMVQLLTSSLLSLAAVI